jgi:hypothetical protein
LADVHRVDDTISALASYLAAKENHEVIGRIASAKHYFTGLEVERMHLSCEPFQPVGGEVGKDGNRKQLVHSRIRACFQGHFEIVRGGFHNSDLT